ncbi:MAG TPA: polyprenyl synthetase family protein [Anaerolineae bacterium]|nr:polyprenyl synthetase family protein [Anaerolineae bacterium]MCB0177313.1 polyprenyl synthetase family protein [Anaerolineae bacterium]MCB0222634.1 polyprenyl synthetase family protein [Anaerolineae bacterium]MCB9105744.1 polyprenyl synthetase family protein [Anaerolineales bacterium]HRV91549.1 polyprenyl synthetase family protein [Anaerolineae bacterium]
MVKASDLLSLVADDMIYVEDKMRSGIPEQHQDLQSVVDYLVGAGGKRLRPALTMMAASFYPVDKDKLYCLAAAVELLHTATLVHDDLIDNSLFRRGMPTLNVSWSPAATILTGDFLFARSAQLAAQTDSVRIVNIFAETLMTIVGGELNQLFNDGHERVPTIDEYHGRIYAKTASLFAGGTEMGGILSHAPEEQIGALRDFGYYLGMAFQVVDDILDFKGDEDHIGKPVANDLRQGIATLPVMLFNEKQPNHPTILKAVRKDFVNDAEILDVVNQIRASGCVEASMEEAVRFARQAQAALEKLPDTPYRQAMYGLADYTITRDI